MKERTTEHTFFVFTVLSHWSVFVVGIAFFKSDIDHLRCQFKYVFFCRQELAPSPGTAPDNVLVGTVNDWATQSELLFVFSSEYYGRIAYPPRFASLIWWHLPVPNRTQTPGC
jgi:hypothetical protein